VAVVPVLEAVDLGFAYGRRQVLGDVTAALAPGEVLGVIGPNGSGKSTLVRLLGGLAAPRAGEVRLGGRPLLAWPRRERARWLAVVPQDARLEFAFTVLEVALMGRAPHLSSLGFAGPSDVARVREVLGWFEVDHLVTRRMDDLSGGERQRVFLARAFAQDPRVLLLDEPTAHLDLRHQRLLSELLRTRARVDGLAIVMVLHDLNLVAATCDRVLVLAGGRPAALGPPAVVYRAELLARVFDAPLEVHYDPATGGPLVVPCWAAAASEANLR